MIFYRFNIFGWAPPTEPNIFSREVSLDSPLSPLNTLINRETTADLTVCLYSQGHSGLKEFNIKVLKKTCRSEPVKMQANLT